MFTILDNNFNSDDLHLTSSYNTPVLNFDYHSAPHSLRQFDLESDDYTNPYSPSNMVVEDLHQELKIEDPTHEEPIRSDDFGHITNVKWYNYGYNYCRGNFKKQLEYLERMDIKQRNYKKIVEERFKQRKIIRETKGPQAENEFIANFTDADPDQKFPIKKYVHNGEVHYGTIISKRKNLE